MSQDFYSQKWTDFIRKYDHFSIAEWLRKSQGLSHRAIALIGIYHNIEKFLTTSLVEGAIDECLFTDPKLIKMDEGFDQVCFYFT